MKNKISIIALSVISVFVLAGAAPDRAEGFNPYLSESGTGSTAPDFTLKDLSGHKVSLSSFRGKHVLLNFWATWCPYCRKERAHLNSLQKEYKEKGLLIVSVATDSSVEKVREFVKETPLDFIVLTDALGSTASSYGIRGYPTSLLIDREGRIKHKVAGFVEWSGRDAREVIDLFISE